MTTGCLTFLLLGFLLEQAAAAPWLAIASYLIAYVCGGVSAAVSAYEGLRERSINVDVLMLAAAIGAAYVGEWPEGGTLLFLFSLSGTLEQIVLGKTRRAIEALLDLTPEEATVLHGGVEERVHIESVLVGDTVIVRPGERIPADGVITVGATSVDQSALTGESVPVARSVGEEVFAGTMNVDGGVHLQVTRPAKETMLAKIVQRVEEAQSERATTQRFTDWFGERYTFLVLSASVITYVVMRAVFDFSFHDALYRAMTVLVVASPCAVVISIPATILAAIAGAAGRGILFKGGKHLEAAAGITAVAFDKTGTLTRGRPEVNTIRSFGERTEESLLQLAASAEALSEHPLAEAIVRAAKERSLQLLPAENLQAIAGKGIRAQVGGAALVIGKRRFLEEQGLTISAVVEEATQSLSKAGQTPILLGVDGAIVGAFGLADTLRMSAEPAVRELRRLGVDCTMLTGDHEQIAQLTAKTLGIGYHADLLPEDKLEQIKRLRGSGKVVAMVGDGINDAPSLALATLGVSLGGSGTAVALETADVVLMGDDLKLLPLALDYGRRAQTIIKQNLLIAFGMMLLLLCSTFFLHLRLPLAVAGHEGSTVVVILNGLRMLRKPATATER